MVCCLVDKHWTKRVLAQRADPYLHKVLLSIMAVDIFLVVMASVSLQASTYVESDFPEDSCEIPPDVDAVAATKFAEKHVFLWRSFNVGALVTAVLNLESLCRFHATHFWAVDDLQHGSTSGTTRKVCYCCTLHHDRCIENNSVGMLEANTLEQRMCYTGPSILGEDLSPRPNMCTKASSLGLGYASAVLGFVAFLIGSGMVIRWCVVRRQCVWFSTFDYQYSVNHVGLRCAMLWTRRS